MALKVPDKIVKLKRYLQSFDIEERIDKELEKLERRIVELNKIQIKKGERADKSTIRPEYTNYTIVTKRERGTLTNNDPFIVNLNDRGKFQAGFYVLITPKQVIIDSTDSKSDDLQDKYGENIFGLNESNLNLILTEVKNKILADVRKELNNI